MEQYTLFDRESVQPLAAKLRPSTLENFVGQAHLLGECKVLRRLIESDQVSSMIFWGPPGVGKTTLARIIANYTKAAFIDFSAVTSGIKEIRTVMQQAVGAGVMMPLLQVVVLKLFPIEGRGRAMGVVGPIVGFSPTIGPTLSGLLVDSFGWRSLFYILTFISILVIISAYFLLENIGTTMKSNLDILSLILYALGFCGIMLGVTNEGIYGWMSVHTMSATVIIPIYVQTMRGYSAFYSGLLMLPGSLLLAVLNPLTGHFLDKYSARGVFITGMIFLLVGTLAFNRYNTTGVQKSFIRRFL
ncbi:MFS transporter (plasmid) [Clostridium estertheticum]|nr:MFS transporter [Clostridium estertheticum]